MQHMLYLMLACIYVMVYGQLVAQRGNVLAQEPVAVERTDEILHYLVLAGRKLHVYHLLLEPVVERHLVAVGYLLIVSILVVACHILRGLRHLVVHSDARKGLVERRLALLTLVDGVKVVVFV